jgi:hypothetical protein
MDAIYILCVSLYSVLKIYKSITVILLENLKKLQKQNAHCLFLRKTETQNPIKKALEVQESSNMLVVIHSDTPLKIMK